MHAFPGDNLSMEGNQKLGAQVIAMGSVSHSAPGALVIATLCNPARKFWGMILALAPEGLSLSGAELASFEDLAVMVRDGEPFSPAVVFFPMHRIERVELDLPDGNLPSLSQRFLNKTGLNLPKCSSRSLLQTMAQPIIPRTTLSRTVREALSDLHCS